MAQRKKLTVRYDEADLEIVKEAAWLRKVSTSEWIRSITIAQAKATIDKLKTPPTQILVSAVLLLLA